MGDNTSLSYIPKILLPFPPFPGGEEKSYTQFSRELFDEFKIFLRIVIKVLEVYNLFGLILIATQLLLNFSR